MNDNWIRSIYFLGLMSMILSIQSCAFQYDIVSEAESDTDFQMYKTFNIIHDNHGFEIGADPVNKKRIDQAVQKEFRDIGYVYAKKPDLQIAWFIKMDTKLEQGIYNAYYTKWRYPRAMDVYEYQQGSLVIDVIDTRTGMVVWHAKVSGKVEEGMPDVEDKIKKVVRELFKSYRKDTGINKIKVYAFK